MHPPRLRRSPKSNCGCKNVPRIAPWTSTTEGIAGLRALIEDQILSWNEEHKRGLRPFALGDSNQLAERAYRNLAGYGPLTELLEDDDVWEVIIKRFTTCGY